MAFVTGVSASPIVTANETNEWHYELTPYFFAAGLNGQTGIQGVTADVDMSFSDIWDRFDQGLMAYFEAGKDRWFYGIEGVYFKLADEGATSVSGPFGNVSVEGALQLTTSMNVYQATTGYRIQDHKTKLDVLAALRYTKVDVDANVVITTVPGIVFPGGATSASVSESWVDVVIGARVLHPLTQNWTLVGYADIGAGGSDLTYQAIMGANWQFAKDYSAKFGYRYMDWDYDKNNFVWNMTTSGIYAGLGIQF